MTPTEAQRLSEQAKANTDRELWREGDGDGDGMSYYEPSIHVTEQGGIGINVGGYVLVKTLREWHSLARQLAEAKRENERYRDVLLDILDVTTGWSRKMTNAEKLAAIDALARAALNAIKDAAPALAAPSTDSVGEASGEGNAPERGAAVSGESSTDRATTGVEGAA